MKKLFLSLIAATLCISQVAAQCEIPIQSVSTSFSTGWPPCWYSSGVNLTFETIIFNTGGGGDRWVVLPMTVDCQGILEFDAINTTNSQAGPGNFQFGVASVTGAGAMATFELVEAMDIYYVSSNGALIYTHHVIDFSAYAGTGQYIVIWMSGAVSREVRLDNVVYTSDCLISGPCTVPEPPKTFVDQDATGNNDGTSWADAYTSLQTALTAGGTNDIWVAEGTYTPHASDRDASFIIPNTAKVYGGFAGTETLLSERDMAAHPTILSGDLLGNDNANIMHTEATRQDNSYHVVKLRGNALNIVVDGFTISGGNANGPNANTCATAAASQYYHVRGGAIYANPYAASNVIGASFNNCILEKNTGLNVAVYTSFVSCGVSTTTTDVDFNHCIIRKNYSHELTAMLYAGSSGYSNFSYGSLNNSLMYDNVSGANASCLSGQQFGERRH